LISADNP
jgi:carboxy-terminal domain RNA polymerase II polypeptide A small phosphatase